MENVLNFFELCKAGSSENIINMIKTGIDVNIRDENGWTPLMYAAWYNQNPEIIKTLLEAGADPKMTDDFGKKAVDYARKNEALKGTIAVKMLEDIN